MKDLSADPPVYRANRQITLKRFAGGAGSYHEEDHFSAYIEPGGYTLVRECIAPMAGYYKKEDFFAIGWFAFTSIEEIVEKFNEFCGKTFFVDTIKDNETIQQLIKFDMARVLTNYPE